MRSGVSAHTQKLAKEIRHYLGMQAIEEGGAPLVGTASRLFQQLVYQNKDQLVASILCAGWDPVHGGQVFEIPLGGSMVEVPYGMSGSGSSYIYGYCDATYRPGMSKEECQQFAKNAVSLAMSRDGSSGGIMRMVTVTKDKVERTYVSQDELPYK